MDSGRLQDEPVAVVCRRLATESRTGCLHLSGPTGTAEQIVRIYVRDGRIYTATSPGGRARLGERMVSGGHLTGEQLDRALQIQQDEVGGVRLGDVLVAQGLVTREVLRRVIREQISDSVAVALGRGVGAWRFAHAETVAEDVPLGLSTQDALMEAARRLGQLDVIRERLGSLDVVVDFIAGTTEVRLSLKADEWAMLTHIDGRNSVAEIAGRAGYSHLEAARIVFGLLSAGVVTVVGGPAVDHAVPAAPPQRGVSSIPAPPPDATATVNAVPAPPPPRGRIGRLRSSHEDTPR